MTLTEVLKKYQSQFSFILPLELKESEIMKFDLSVSNSSQLQQLNIHDTALLTRLMFQVLKKSKAKIAVGGYLEHRMIYERSENFDNNDEPRRIHLGVDVWGEALIPILAPLKGVVHSFQDNQGFGDYGPTIILEHQLEGHTFYTLYGHLSRSSLENLQEGQVIEQGQAFAYIGNFPENGDWPPHLHFQLITDLLGKKGDFVGVCAASEKDFYAKICLNPNLILGISHLN